MVDSRLSFPHKEGSKDCKSCFVTTIPRAEVSLDCSQTECVSLANESSLSVSLL